MYEFNLETCKLHISKGNSKLGEGVFNLSLLPSDSPLYKKDGTKITNIAGTCVGCCDNCKHDCYAVKSAIMHHNSCIPAWGENTMLARHDLPRFERELQDFLDNNLVYAFRWHTAGEIPSVEYLHMMVRIAENNPLTHFYVYTKRYSWIESLDTIPSNLHITVSVWHNNYKNPCGFHEFIYDDGTEDLSNIFHCPAVNKKGHRTNVTCAKCRRCLLAKKGEKTAVYAH